MAGGPRSWIAQLRDLPHLLAALRRDFLFANRRLTAAFIFYCVKLGVAAVLFLVYLVVRQVLSYIFDQMPSTAAITLAVWFLVDFINRAQLAFQFLAFSPRSTSFQKLYLAFSDTSTTLQRWSCFSSFALPCFVEGYWPDSNRFIMYCSNDATNAFCAEWNVDAFCCCCYLDLQYLSLGRATAFRGSNADSQRAAPVN